jgi:hypothetical protein
MANKVVPHRQKTLKEIIADEYKRCAVDPIYFMKKYCLIQHPTKGKVQFQLYPFQEKTLIQFEEHRFNLILKSRQLGISTLSAAYSVWKMIFNEDFNILVIAIKQEVAKNLVTKVRVMFDNLPTWMKVPSAEDNKLSLRLTNGSQIKAVAATPDAGRSEALSLLIIDEAAFIDYADEIWTSATPTLSTGGSCIALSTPNGVGGWFHKQWVGSEEGTNEFNPISLHWTVHPDRDQSWRDTQDKILGPKLAKQECDVSFVSSGNTVIDPEVLQFYKDTYVMDPIEKTAFDGNLWKWEFPDYNRAYMVVADVSRGDGADYSTAHVIDIDNMVQVAEYKGKMDTKDFGNFLVSLSTDYNEALLVVENSNIGWATIQQIIDRGYGNLFYMSADMKYVDIERQMTNKYRREERQMIAGFSTTSKTRPLIISKLYDYFTERTVIIRSVRTIDELFTFIWLNGRAEAMRGYNDDLVMALSIGMWVRDTALRLRQQGIELTKKAVSGITTETYSGIYGGSGMDTNPWKMQIGDDEEDLSKWL